jgi:uncharacterized protein YkwD
MVLVRIEICARRAVRFVSVAALLSASCIASTAPAHSLTVTQTNASVTSISVHLNAPVVAVVATPTGRGYWRAAADGGVLTAGDAHYYGSAVGMWHDVIVGMAATADGRGYWLVDRAGNVFRFGDAPFYGSMGGHRLRRPIVGMASTPDGRGYWLVASDGGVFAFNAPFRGSTGALQLFRPIVGMAPTPDGQGYWLVASDGGVFAFHAPFLGSTGGRRLRRPVVGMTASLDAKGYELVAADGGVFTFGKVSFFGSAAYACPGAPAVGVASSPGALGYWITFANAQTYAFSPSTTPPKCAPPASPALSAMQADLFKRVNDERAARGLPALQWDPWLAGYASGWATHMGNANTFSHSDIASLLGTYDFVGENIAKGGPATPTGQLHNAWMQSDEHRANMLSRGFTRIGIGAFCADGAIWLVQDFGRLSTQGPPPSSPLPPAQPVARPDFGSVHC